VGTEVLRSWIVLDDGGASGFTVFWQSCLVFQLGPSTFFSMIPLVDGPSVPAD
jgi:hypothetical protein